MPKEPKFIIHVLVRKCESTHKWIAQGLEHDIVVQADTLKLLKQRFFATVLGYAHAYSNKAEPLKEIGRAPQAYWTLFNKLQEGSRNSQIRPFPKKSKTPGEAIFLQAA
jgi:hypothetical protein